MEPIWIVKFPLWRFEITCTMVTIDLLPGLIPLLKDIMSVQATNGRHRICVITDRWDDEADQVMVDLLTCCELDD